MTSFGVLVVSAGLLAYVSIRGMLWTPGLMNMDWQLMRATGAYKNRLISEVDRRDFFEFIGRAVEMGPNWQTSAADISNGIYSVWILNMNREVVDRYPHGSELPKIDEAGLQRLGLTHPSRYPFLDRASRQVLVAPLVFQGTQVGFVVMSNPYTFRKQLLDGFVRNAGLVGLLVLLATLLFHLVVTGILIHPLQRLAESVGRVMAGDLSARTGLQGGKNEVFQVGASFDQMVGRLQQMFATEQAFVADVSHELRTPLTALNGQLHILRTLSESSPAEARRDRALNRSQHEVDRMIGLVEDLLALMRAEAPVRTPIALAMLVSEALEATRAVFPDRTIQVGSIPDVNLSGNGPALVRALSNLLENACNYTGSEGSIWLEAKAIAQTVEIVVRDQGCGIPHDAIEHLGERFYRPDPSRSRQTGGSGLGIAISKATMEKHGGSLQYQSEVGKGTTVVMRLPLQP